MLWWLWWLCVRMMAGCRIRLYSWAALGCTPVSVSGLVKPAISTLRREISCTAVERQCHCDVNFLKLLQ